MLTRRPPQAQVARRLMDRWLGDGFLTPTFETALADTAPSLNVRETPDAYVVEVEMAGIEPDAIDVTVEGRTLTIRGSYEESEERQGTYLLREWRSGTFLRSVALPAVIDADNASSEVQNGELILTLPKAAQNRARRLQIGRDSRNGHEDQVTNAGDGRSAKQVSAGSTSETTEVQNPR